MFVLLTTILSWIPKVGLPFLEKYLEYYKNKEDNISKERARYLEASILELKARTEVQLKELDYWLFRFLKGSVIAIAAVYLWAILVDSIGQQIFWWNWDVLAHPLLDFTTELVVAYLFLVSGYKVLTR